MPEVPAAWSPRVLTATEFSLKRELESRIDRVVSDIAAAQDTLLEIHRLGLYLADAPTFHEYLRKRWPRYSDRTIYRLVAQVKVEEDLADEGESESADESIAEPRQAAEFPRPSQHAAEILNRFPNSKRAEIWRLACLRAAAEGKQPTAVTVEHFWREYRRAEDTEPTTEDVIAAEEEIAAVEEDRRDAEARKGLAQSVRLAKRSYPGLRDEAERDAWRAYVDAAPARKRR